MVAEKRYCVICKQTVMSTEWEEHYNACLAKKTVKEFSKPVDVEAVYEKTETKKSVK